MLDAGAAAGEQQPGHQREGLGVAGENVGGFVDDEGQGRLLTVFSVSVGRA